MDINYLLEANRENAELKERLSIAEEALEKLAKLGNGDRYGNSIGNEIALRTLTKLRETKIKENKDDDV